MLHYPDSYYAASADISRIWPRATGALNADVAILGGGFTGLSAAIDLARAGKSVIVLEQGRIGWGASGRNGGQICTSFSPGIEKVESLLPKETARRLWQLAFDAKALIAERVADSGQDCDVRWGYITAAMKRSHLEELEEMEEGFARYGLSCGQLLDADGVKAHVNSPAYIGGHFDPTGGHLHPLKYARALADLAKRAGVQIFEQSKVERLHRGPAPALETAEATVRAKTVILAGNAYLGWLVPALKRKIMPVTTFVAATEPLSEDQARATLPGNPAVCDCRLDLDYYRLSAERRLLFGGGVSYSGAEPRDAKAKMHRKITAIFPTLQNVAVEKVWSGKVGITSNRLPDIGQLSDSIYYAHGFSGQGVSMTGIAARSVARAIDDDRADFDAFASIPHQSFPGGKWFATPALVSVMAVNRVRDWLSK